MSKDTFFYKCFHSIKDLLLELITPKRIYTYEAGYTLDELIEIMKSIKKEADDISWLEISISQKVLFTSDIEEDILFIKPINRNSGSDASARIEIITSNEPYLILKIEYYQPKSFIITIIIFSIPIYLGSIFMHASIAALYVLFAFFSLFPLINYLSFLINWRKVKGYTEKTLKISSVRYRKKT